MLTQSRLKELLSYDKETGIFIWLIDIGKSTRKGDIAGCTSNGSGYVLIGIKGKLYRAHRLAHLYVNGVFPTGQVDHENHVRNDNKWLNINRSVTHNENHKNTKMKKNNTSGVTGVTWDPLNNNWRSRIKVGRKHVHIGSFITFFAAVYARHAANIKYGYHTNHGK